MKSERMQCLMTLLALTVESIPLAAAQTRMFKCMSEGHTVYQQTACPVSQQASEVSSAARAASASVDALPARPTRRDKAAARAAMNASEPAAAPSSVSR